MSLLSWRWKHRVSPTTIAHSLVQTTLSKDLDENFSIAYPPFTTLPPFDLCLPTELDTVSCFIPQSSKGNVNLQTQHMQGFGPDVVRISDSDLESFDKLGSNARVHFLCANFGNACYNRAKPIGFPRHIGCGIMDLLPALSVAPTTTNAKLFYLCKLLHFWATQHVCRQNAMAMMDVSIPMPRIDFKVLALYLSLPTQKE